MARNNCTTYISVLSTLFLFLFSSEMNSERKKKKHEVVGEGRQHIFVHAGCIEIAYHYIITKKKTTKI